MDRIANVAERQRQYEKVAQAKAKAEESAHIDPNSLTNPQSVEMHKYAEASQVAYDYRVKNADTIRKDYPHLAVDDKLSDDESVVIKYPNNEVNIAYRGSVGLVRDDFAPSFAGFKDWLTTNPQIALGIPELRTAGPAGERIISSLSKAFPKYKKIAELASEFDRGHNKYLEVQKHYPNATITTSGHSKGGAVSLFVSRKNDLDSFNFSSGSSPLGAFPRWMLAKLGASGDNPETTHKLYTSGFRDVINNMQKYLPTNTDHVYFVDACKSGECRGQDINYPLVHQSIGHSLANFLPPKYMRTRPDLFMENAIREYKPPSKPKARSKLGAFRKQPAYRDAFQPDLQHHTTVRTYHACSPLDLHCLRGQGG
jgi:hypothetical protein